MQVPASRTLAKIQQGAVANGYLLFGTELYWRDRICESLKNALGLKTGSLGLAEFDLRQDSLDKVLEKAQSQNLLSPRQLLFVKNAQGLLSSRGRQGKASLDTTETPTKRSEELAAYFRHPNPSSTVAFEIMDVNLDSEDWRERDKVKTRLEAFEDVFQNRCEVVLLRSPSFAEARELVQAEAAERGCQISPPAAELLIATFHRNMALILLELEKLSLFAPEKKGIDVEDVNRMVAGAGGDAGLELTEAIGARDARLALQVLDGLRRRGKYPPLVVSELARYLRQLIILKESKVHDARPAGKLLWEAKLFTPQAALPGLLKQARQFTGSQLLRGLKLAFEADLALRSSLPDEGLVLERFVLELMHS